MTLQEIKDAVLTGKTVHWSNSNYKVIHEKNDWVIGYKPGEKGENYIGLTWRDGETLNGKEEDFYVQGYHSKKALIDFIDFPEGSYHSAAEIAKVFEKEFDDYSKNYEEIELRVKNVPYEGDSLAFYGITKH